MNDTTEKPKSKSIIDPSRRSNMLGASDWVGEFMEAAALTKGVGARAAVAAVAEEKDAEGNVIVAAVAAVSARKGEDLWDLDKMFLLGERNGIDTTNKTYSGIRAAKAVGRGRMTLSNQLRAAARKRHGLFDIEGNWVVAPESARNPGEPTEGPDGVKIKKPAKDDVDAVKKDAEDNDSEPAAMADVE